MFINSLVLEFAMGWLTKQNGMDEKKSWKMDLEGQKFEYDKAIKEPAFDFLF